MVDETLEGRARRRLNEATIEARCDERVLDMAVYFILTQTITDPVRYQNEYLPGVRPFLEKYRAEVLVADHAATPVQGDPTRSVVVIKFPSENLLKEFLDDPDYRPMKELRFAITTNAHAVMAAEFPTPRR